MARRKVRDIYGNWTWQDGELNDDRSDRIDDGTQSDHENDLSKSQKNDQAIDLDWRDWIAITVASIETILLPLIVIVVILVILAIVIGHSA